MPLRARGRTLWFIDHDALATPRTLGRLLGAMRRFGAGIAGGPNLASLPQGRAEAVAAAVIGSTVGSPLVAARYGGRSSTGPAGERDLILCNLAIDREEFLAAGGFDPRLYPNEENALINGLVRRGVRAIHVHDAPVRKPRPATLRRFLVESFRYGRGRMEQIWVAAAAGDAVFVLAFAAAIAGLVLAAVHPWLFAVAASAYGTAGWRAARSVGAEPGGRPTAAACAGWLAARHAAYAAGMCWGLVAGWRQRRLRWRPMQATLRRHWPGPVAMRLVDTVSCRIGSIAKEA